MENNFKDPKTGKEYFISQYRTQFDAAGNIEKYGDKQGKELVGEDGVTPLVYIDKQGEYSVSYGKFQSSTPAQRQQILKKRHLEHSKKNVDKFHQMNKPNTKT